jgi:cation diffusion facilitator CzcD-associated flavoprotein CzcO
MLPEVAKTAAQVTVFQRTPNFVMPAVQKPMTPEWEEEIKANYEQIIRKCRNHSFGMAFDSPVGRNLADTPPEEVQRILEEHWPRGSFRFVFETFDDLIVNAESNRVVGDFIIRKMKERVNDPEIVGNLAAFSGAPMTRDDELRWIARVNASFTPPRSPDLDTGWYDVAQDTAADDCVAGFANNPLWAAWGTGSCVGTLHGFTASSNRRFFGVTTGESVA